jgi:hypothetical protein
MGWERGRVASPQANRAIIIKDNEPRETWFRVRYTNCEPEPSSWDRLRKKRARCLPIMVAMRYAHIDRLRSGGNECVSRSGSYKISYLKV